MKLSTKGRYGVRLMIDLATNYGKGFTFLKEISKRQSISEKYLWQVISPLKSAGLVISGRGAKGGYMLSKNPKSITIKDIIEVLEGSFAPVFCVDNPENCKRSKDCATKDLWSELNKRISKFLESISLQDMALRQSKKQGSYNDSMYYI